MKKLLALFIAVFFVTGFVYAQNNSTVDQLSGVDNDAYVTQEGNFNTSEVTQANIQ